MNCERPAILCNNNGNNGNTGGPQSRDYIMVLTKTDQGIELVKINKDTGESEKSISLGKNRKPNYAIDLIEGIVYLEIDKNFIKQYLL